MTLPIYKFSRRMMSLAAVAVALSAGGHFAFAQGTLPEKIPAPKSQQPAALPAVAAPTIQTMTLGQCLQIAAERQPAIAAARASLHAKQTSANGLQQPRFAYLLAHDIHIRRAQACIGVNAAAAELMQIECDTVYAVTRTYYTAVYAAKQIVVITELIKELEEKRGLMQRVIKESEGTTLFKNSDILRMDSAIEISKARLVEAEVGVQRSINALREAMGVASDCGFEIVPADTELPDPAVIPDRCEIVKLAVDRRGEMIQVLVAANVFRLEVDAQGKHCFRPTVRTFAASADIHATPVPPGEHNGTYRPGAVAFEMPTQLAGPKWSRVCQAQSYAGRAEAVVQKTRELITLEAEEAYMKWTESARKIEPSSKAAKSSREHYKELSKQFLDTLGKVPPENIAVNRAFQAQAEAAENEARFQKVIALANLERVTGCGFASGLLCN